MEIDKRFLNPETPPENVYGILVEETLLPKKRACHTHNFCECTIIFSGTVNHQINGTNQILLAHQLCFVRSDDTHALLQQNNEPVTLYNIGLPSLLLKEIADYYNYDISLLLTPKLPPVVTLDNTSYHALKNKLLMFHSTPYGTKHAVLFKSIISDFIFLLINEVSSNDKTLPTWFVELLDSMSIPENFIIGIPRLLELSNYSQEYLNRCFRKYLNTTPTNYINDKRVNYAAKQMVNHNVSISKAGLSSGFLSLSHFYREFKRYYKCTPNQYVNNLLKEAETLL